MQYSPKLKKAMQRIQQVLEEEDLSGIVVIHTPGFSEYLMKLDPSYSCAKIEGEAIRIKAKSAEYPGGDKERDEKLKDTSNMMHHLSINSARLASNLIDIDSVLTKMLNADHFGGGHTSHIEQNN